MKILVLAAHPDDELLGVGGTVSKHISAGDTVECVIFGEGLTAREIERNKTEGRALERLHADARKAAGIIGFSDFQILTLPDNRFDQLDLLDVVKQVETVVAKAKPDIIYTHHGGDVNIDHQILFRAVMTACRPITDWCPKKIYTFETLSSTEWKLPNNDFSPNTFVNISSHLKKKQEALAAYTSEMRDYPHSRSLRGVEILARYRGMQAGIELAEAFRLVRDIQ